MPIYYPMAFGGLVIAANILALVRSPGHIITLTNTIKMIIEISVNYLYFGLYDRFLFLCLNKSIS